MPMIEEPPLHFPRRARREARRRIDNAAHARASERARLLLLTNAISLRKTSVRRPNLCAPSSRFTRHPNDASILQAVVESILKF